jgi:hypothetical protein
MQGFFKDFQKKNQGCSQAMPCLRKLRKKTYFYAMFFQIFSKIKLRMFPNNVRFKKVEKKTLLCNDFLKIKKIKCLLLTVYILRPLGPKSPLDERQIMEDKLSSCTGSMPQIWPRRLCS